MQAGMRRDYFTLDAAGVETDDSGRPIVRITYEGPTEELESRLRRGGTPLDGDGVDITYRLQDAIRADAPNGVFAIADRVTYSRSAWATDRWSMQVVVPLSISSR